MNGAAIALAQLGRIGAVSCMVGAPAWSAGAASLRKLDPQLVDAGLHLDLTQHPVSSSARMPLVQWIARGSLRLLDARALRSEIHAQLDRFEADVGRPPAHVDGHEHVHQLPGVREALVSILAERYPGRLPWVRSTRGPRPQPPPRLKAGVIETLGENALRRLCKAAGIRQNDHLLGIYGFDGGEERYLALLAGWLQAASNADVLLCHPSRTNDTQPFPAARRQEFEVLAGTRFGALVAASGIRLAPLR
jgi:predicted glycoside hydrolase/deacetylase ChbG (UPF0249 family)